MDNQEFPSNSQRGKKTPASDEGKKIEPIAGVVGVTRKKRSLGKRFKDAFFGGTTEGVGTYVLFEVMLPAAKDMIVDAGGEALHRAVYGESRPAHARGRGRGSSGISPLGHIAYDTISSRAAQPRQEHTPLSRRARANFEFDEIILPQRHIADEVLDRMFMLLEKYQAVTVADLYELLDISAQHTDDKWGWVDLFGSSVTRVSGGYMLNLPQPISLN